MVCTLIVNLNDPSSSSSNSWHFYVTRKILRNCLRRPGWLAVVESNVTEWLTYYFPENEPRDRTHKDNFQHNFMQYWLSAHWFFLQSPVANLINILQAYTMTLESQYGQFSSQYNSRVVNYKHKCFVRLTTGIFSHKLITVGSKGLTRWTRVWRNERGTRKKRRKSRRRSTRCWRRRRRTGAIWRLGLMLLLLLQLLQVDHEDALLHLLLIVAVHPAKEVVEGR